MMTEESITNLRAWKAHLALNVRNVSNSVEFYKKMLGIEPSKTRNGYAKFDVQNPPLNLTLNQGAFSERGALSHMGIQVGSTEDVLAMRIKWIESGLITRDEMQTNCCYALQDKSWVTDPDGNEWEVFVVLKDNLPQTATCCGTETGADNLVRSDASNSICADPVPETASCCGGASIPPVSLSR